MTNLTDQIGKSFPMKELSSSEFSSLKVGPMKFSIRHWDAGKLGNVSLMQAKGMFGLMRMDTLIVNPVLCDMPLLSLDTILAAGKLTVIAELYDTTLGGFDQTSCKNVVSSISQFTDRDAGSHWYDGIKLACSFGKSAKKKDLPVLMDALCGYVDAYLKVAKSCPKLEGEADLAEKRRKADAYTDGLLEHGGPSTDVFVKKLGKDKTSKLFHEVLFG